VEPAGKNAGPVPAVRAALRPGAVELRLGNHGETDVTYTLTPNDYEGSTRTVTVKGGNEKTVRWPVSRDGYYDVVITAGTGDGFRRRCAGRIA
jgi:phospholipase C